MNELQTLSWRRGKAIAFWSFVACGGKSESDITSCPQDLEQLSTWLAERIRRIASSLAPFAILQQLVIETRSGGEAAFTLRGSHTSIQHKFEEVAILNDDIVAAHLSLALCCTDLDGARFNIQNGARIVIEPAFDQHGKVIANEEINMRLSLNVDIYSPRNPCPQPDNMALAKLNGPLLRDFIARLEAQVPCQFELASGDEYRDFISGRGFELG